MATDYEQLINDIRTNSNLAPFVDIIQEISELTDEELNNETVEIISQLIETRLQQQKNTIIDDIISGFEKTSITKEQAKLGLESFYRDLTNFSDKMDKGPKQQLISNIFNVIYVIASEAADKYHNYNIELPIKLGEGAKMPKYAHDTDACADVYASEDMTLPAHSLSNMVHTGIRIALPESWVMMIDPRSSIGLKSGLRLSNSIGIIDEDYRGEICILYDNISDSDYEIKAGDRIAQMWIQPVYRFKPVEVVELPSTDRGEGGFGSTGK